MTNRIRRTAQPFGNGGHITVPKTWIGRIIHARLTDKHDANEGDEEE